MVLIGGGQCPGQLATGGNQTGDRQAELLRRDRGGYTTQGAEKRWQSMATKWLGRCRAVGGARGDVRWPGRPRWGQWTAELTATGDELARQMLSQNHASFY